MGPPPFESGGDPRRNRREWGGWHNPAPVSVRPAQAVRSRLARAQRPGPFGPGLGGVEGAGLGGMGLALGGVGGVLGFSAIVVSCKA
jgi:hypothetical protein